MDFKSSVSSGCLQLKLQISGFIFKILFESYVGREELIRFGKDLEQMIRGKLKKYVIALLGEFWFIEFLVQEGELVELRERVSDV